MGKKKKKNELKPTIEKAEPSNICRALTSSCIVVIILMIRVLSVRLWGDFADKKMDGCGQSHECCYGLFLTV